MFCLRYPEECEVSRITSRRGRIGLSDASRTKLITVNIAVNRAIAPRRKSTNVLESNWVISPLNGDCNDYAITKRHALHALGWPLRSLLLAEVITSLGEHHLVLVVRTRKGDFVLDNLAPTVHHWYESNYRWVRMQSPNNPKLWWEIHTMTS